MAANDFASALAALGGIFLVLGVFFLVWLVLSAIFIHIAARVMGFGASLGTAMRAVLWQVLFGFVLGILFALSAAIFPPLAVAAPVAVQWLGATLGIRQAYQVEFFRALIAAFLSGLFAWVAIVLLVIVLMILTGVSLQQMRQKIEAEKRPTTTVQWREKSIQSGFLARSQVAGSHTLSARPLSRALSFNKNGTAFSAHCAAVG